MNQLHKKYIFLLTATPVQNSLEELYNLITLLKPGQLKTYNFFKKHFVKDKQGLEAKNVNELKTLLYDVMIRNRRSNVDIVFPKRVASTIMTTLSPGEQKLYEEITDFIRTRYDNPSGCLSRFTLKNLQEEMGSSFIAVLPMLKHLAENINLDPDDRPKMAEFYNEAAILAQRDFVTPKLMQTLKIVRGFKDKIIIFTKYKATLQMLYEFLTGEGLQAAIFHGGLRRKEKEAQIEFFRDKAQVLISTESGGEGRNLQFCNAILNFDLPWNPMAIGQRIGRIHRIGQERTVYVYNLAAKGTVEEYILDLLDRKINMFELVIGETDMLLGNIEDKDDFSEIVMNAWTHFSDMTSMEQEMKSVEEALMKNRQQIERIKKFDSSLLEKA